MVRRSMSLATPKGFGVMDRSHRDRLWTVERPQKTAVPEPRDRRAREGGCSGDGSVSFQVSPPQGNLPLRSILESRPSCPSPSRLFGNLVRVPSRTRVPPRFLDRRSFWLEETGTRAWGVRAGGRCTTRRMGVQLRDASTRLPPLSVPSKDAMETPSSAEMDASGTSWEDKENRGIQMAERQVEFQAEVVVEHRRKGSEPGITRRRSSYEAREAAMTTIAHDGSVIRRRHVVSKRQVGETGRGPRWRLQRPSRTNARNRKRGG